MLLNAVQDINDRTQRKMSVLRCVVLGLPAAGIHAAPMGVSGLRPPYAY
jgi:hypothetical protein